jgi:hypothetical protein
MIHLWFILSYLIIIIIIIIIIIHK